MEEILTSIRRLIAEDEAELGAAPPPSDGRRPLTDRVARAWAAAPVASTARAPQPLRGSAALEVGSRLSPAAAEIRGREPAGRVPGALEAETPLVDEAQVADVADPMTATLAHISPKPVAFDVVSAVEEPQGAGAFVEAEAPEVEAEAPESEPALVSAETAASVTAQFQSLVASKVLNDTGLLHEYAREMLRPMLKAWLDDHLPALVERLVRAEIERVARGGRR
ncbi:PopZ family protein [Methylocystis bryophila]|uniref:Pole-organizing protein PopZ n=1 Tax=Methylocystis bryophila TaxID=655015 RepID=A0A1W6MS77_9HYPH|nr:DUF2497 domain-containing protein [Methylocystis bryophila]ARN80412.1 hypothetical protein B1812_04200 [Methylocystis bryophila]BDV40414.1 hypothetical protein DSM21852_36670 [Methylocystis bryophila]